MHTTSASAALTLRIEALTAEHAGLDLTEPEPWQKRGLCAQTDPECFFPVKGETNRHAKRTCQQCPVKAECLATALANPDLTGIWGGTSRLERDRMRRQRRTQIRQPAR